MKKYTKRILAGIIVLACLVFAYWWGGDSPSLHGWDPSGNASSNQYAIKGAGDEATKNNRPESTENGHMSAEEKELAADKIAKESEENKVESSNQTNDMAESHDSNDISYDEPDKQPAENHDGKENDQGDKENKDLNAKESPSPVNSEDIVNSDQQLTCTLTVRCDTILSNITWLDEEKVELVPKDGIIYATREVVFYEGESVFNVLLREMKKNKIHMEFVNTPVYNSVYIEGIANLYEYDCGELSGWMYKVNGDFPNYGCSRYLLKDGDSVEWVYTCNLGVDVGGRNSAKNGMI